MAACGGYVVGRAGIVAAERPGGLRADRLGIGDDVIERDTQSLVQPFAESGRILERRLRRRGVVGGRFRQPCGKDGRRAPDAGEAASAVVEGSGDEAVAGFAFRAGVRDLVVDTPLPGTRLSTWEHP